MPLFADYFFPISQRPCVFFFFSLCKQVGKIISPDSSQTSSEIYTVMSLTLAPLTEFLVSRELTYDLVPVWSGREITGPKPKITTQVGQMLRSCNAEMKYFFSLMIVPGALQSSFQWKCQSHEQGIRKANGSAVWLHNTAASCGRQWSQKHYHPRENSGTGLQTDDISFASSARKKYVLCDL